VGIRVDFSKPGEYERVLPQGRAYLEQMLDAVSRVPGVEQAATVGGGLPLTGSWSRTGIEIPGRTLPEGDDDSIDIRTVTPKYLELLRIPLVRGRTLSADDREGGVQVVVLNQAAAFKYWPGQDPLGQHVKIDKKDHVVVGVVADIRHLGPETPPRQECYVALAQRPQIGSTLVMRTRGDPLAVLPSVKAAIWSVNTEQRLTGDTVTMEAYMDRLIAQRRFNMALLSLFGLLGLVIAAVGIYGVMAYLVAQRTNEIGVRMALGASRGRVVSMVLRRAAMLMLAGLAIGSAGAWYLSAGVKTFLFQIEPTDVSVFTGALLTLTIAGLLASAIPAHRAASVDPLIALRHE
jgi:putative ABC transport system permease protein